MKTFGQIREGYASAAQRKAIWANKADGGKGHPDNKKEALSPAQKDSREKNRIGPKGEVGKREYGSDKAKRGFHKSQRGVSGKGDNRNTMSIFDRQPKTALQGNKPKGKLPEVKSEAVDPKATVKDRINKLQDKRQSARAAAAETDSPSDKRRHAMKAQIAQKQIQMAQQRMGQMEAYGASNPKFNAQDMVGHNNKKVFKQKKEDSDAVKAFLAKGGKIKKLPPAKAQGYHGKDDPGKDMHGVMDKPDTKAIGTRKKVKSMEAKVNELSPATKKSYINKAAADIDNRSYAQGTVDATNTKYNGKNNKRIGNRLKGIRRATKEDISNKVKPPFDNAKPVNKDPKDKFGNPIKNRAKHLARQAARNLVNKQKNESSYAKLNKYNKDAQTSKDKATNSAVATILRKGDHSKDLNTMRKREKGLKMVKSRITDKIRKGHKKEGKVNELSTDTKKSYTKKATTDLYGRGLRKGMDIERGSSSLGRTKVVDKDNDRKISNRHAGIYRAQK